MGLGWWYQSLTFETMARDGFKLSASEQVATYLFELLWPKSWRAAQWGTAESWRSQGARDETSTMVASPFGDTVDVLSPRNLSAAVLRRYSSLILVRAVTCWPALRTVRARRCCAVL
jgi:hypothetical protein